MAQVCEESSEHGSGWFPAVFSADGPPPASPPSTRANSNPPASPPPNLPSPHSAPQVVPPSAHLSKPEALSHACSSRPLTSQCQIPRPAKSSSPVQSGSIPFSPHLYTTAPGQATDVCARPGHRQYPRPVSLIPCALLSPARASSKYTKLAVSPCLLETLSVAPAASRPPPQFPLA